MLVKSTQKGEKLKKEGVDVSRDRTQDLAQLRRTQSNCAVLAAIKRVGRAKVYIYFKK